jgi:hypothetical protein
MLSLYLIQILDARHATPPVIWHFCESDPGPSGPSGGSVVRSLILQLLKLDQSLLRYVSGPSVSLDELFSDRNFQTQRAILEDMVRHTSHSVVDCVLDVLDERESKSLEICLERLRGLLPLS